MKAIRFENVYEGEHFIYNEMSYIKVYPGWAQLNNLKCFDPEDIVEVNETNLFGEPDERT